MMINCMNTKTKKCDVCGHTTAAHVDGIKCALCSCTSQRREFVQQNLSFRSTLQTGVIINTRKR